MTREELEVMAGFHGIGWKAGEFTIDSCLNDAIAASAWLEALSYMDRQKLRIILSGQ